MIAALLNQKGGTGKTMLALRVAGAYGREGKRVILIDADCQGSALDWSEQRAKDWPKLLSIMGLLRDPLHPGTPELARNGNLVIIDGIPRRDADGLGFAGR
jgi:chromosome partitioning protein